MHLFASGHSCRSAVRVFPLFLATAGLLASLATVPALADDLTLNGFSRDRVVFDVGAAFGRNEGLVTVSGTRPADAALEVRLVSDSGATAWAPVTSPVPGTGWSAEITSPARSDWMHVEVREVATRTTVRSATTIGFGDVVALIGQSEIKRLGLTINGEPGAPIVTTGDRVQITRRQQTGNIATFDLDNDSPRATGAYLAMAQFWADNMPDGRPLHIVELAEPASGHMDLVDDSRPKRSFAEMAEVVQSLRADGVEIGLAVESWHATSANLSGHDLAATLAPIYSGWHLPAPGADPSRWKSATLGDTLSGPGGETFRLDHMLWDTTGQDRGLFDATVTRLAFVGPHRYDANNSDTLHNATTRGLGNADPRLSRIDSYRREMDLLRANHMLMPHIVSEDLPMALDYANGFIRDGEWIDRIHPSGIDEDGENRFARMLINAALKANGHVDYEVPVLHVVSWSDTRIVVGSTAGALTTARLARGVPALSDAEQEHWTDVLGFEVNGLPVLDARIMPVGRILLLPPEGRFEAGDTLTFGRGGASGFLDMVADRGSLAYLNLPIVDVGLIGLEGVVALPNTSGIATYAGDRPRFGGPGRAPVAAVPLPGSLASLLGATGLLLVFRKRRMS